jgi:hypothetical protein
MMGKHGPTAKLWPSVLGITASVLAIAALILLIIWDPQWVPK